MSNIIYLLHDIAKEHPDRLALKWGSDQSITYREFADKISFLASGLKELGIKKGDRVLIFVPLSVDLYLSMFAIQQLGAIAVFLDSWARRDQLKLCCEIAQPKAMISVEKAFQIPELSSNLIRIPIGSLEELAAKRIGCSIEQVFSDDTALVTFTTGSSGTPKGANRTHRFLAEQHRALSQVIPYNGDETDLPIFPIFALNNLASGITTLLPLIDLSSPSERDAEILAGQILNHAIQSCTLSPSLFIKLGAYGKSLPSLERIVTGGAPISKDHVELFKKIAPKAEILVLYGSTEVEPIAHIEANEMLSHIREREGVNVGRISNGLKVKFIKIFKEDIQLTEKGWAEWAVPSNQPGELVVSGAHVCEGYYNDEAAFNKTKIRESDGTIWHRTGDIGVLDEEGYLWFMGRVHNTILRAGEFLFPVQPEFLLKKLPFVRQAAFLGLEDLKLGERTCAVFSLMPHVEKESSFFDKIEKILKENGIPVDEIRTVDEIPMDPRHHSKVEYGKLRALLI
jgi:acyl-CoA synthetase (AMP-forming)/AMP-acid ligase II